MMGDFYGLPTGKIDNGHLELEYLAGAGPRVVRLALAGSAENLFAELPDVHWSTPYGEYFPRGGHRLCGAPETFPDTYMPDNEGLVVVPFPDGVILDQPAEALTGLQKRMEIHLVAGAARAVVTHRLQNCGSQTVRLAPWAITQMRLDGMAIVPLRPHPADRAGLLPDRSLVLWPYSSWRDPRLRLHDDYALVNAGSRAPACKLGALVSQGWIGYLCQGVFFVKRFQPELDRPYPDRGCNVEVYCNEQFIELETLGPLCDLEPGQTVTHVETWDVYSGLDGTQTLNALRNLALSGTESLKH